MDERKNLIRDLEGKRNEDREERNRLLERLGETLIKRIGESNPFDEDSGETQDAALAGKTGTSPGAVLEEYRLLQKEVDELLENISALEAEALRLKELEAVISKKEAEHSHHKQELEEISVMLGRQLLPAPEFEDLTGSSKQQEEDLLEKIEELESKLETLDEQGGGILSWLGKNAQMVLSKGMLQKNRSALRRLYRSTGEKFLSLEHEKTPDGDAGRTLEKARELKEYLNSLDADLASLKGDRRKIMELFGNDSSPSRRIAGIEKRISHIKMQFPHIYLSLGILASKSCGQNQADSGISQLLEEKDHEVLEKAEALNARIAERELGIKKINTAINIDKKKNEIEKLNKSIEAQKGKIAFAEEAIDGYKRQIAVSEDLINEWETFLRQNS